MNQDGGARLQTALLDPAAVYDSPRDVEQDPALTRDEKLAVLTSWEEDARELAVAEEENMGGGEASRLSEVVAARLRVSGVAQPATAPDKHGGTAAEASDLRVRHFVRQVGPTVHADHDLEEVTLALAEQESPLLPIVDGDEVVGVVARSDLLPTRPAPPSTRLTVRDIMTTELAFCYEDDDAGIARASMDEHDCDHLLVVDEDHALVGIVARADLPPVTGGDAGRPHQRGLRRETSGGVATTVGPGGLGVYADKPKIRLMPGKAGRSRR